MQNNQSAGPTPTSEATPLVHLQSLDFDFFDPPVVAPKAKPTNFLSHRVAFPLLLQTQSVGEFARSRVPASSGEKPTSGLQLLYLCVLSELTPIFPGESRSVILDYFQI